jgi:hypothetical protein
MIFETGDDNSADLKLLYQTCWAFDSSISHIRLMRRQSFIFNSTKVGAKVSCFKAEKKNFERRQKISSSNKALPIAMMRMIAFIMLLLAIRRKQKI